MSSAEKFAIAKRLLESGELKRFEDLFIYVPKSTIAGTLGINYSRFLKLVKDPRPLRYKEAIGIAKILGVKPRAISEIVHYQLERPKTKASGI